MKFEDIRENMLIKRKKANVSWIVWAINKEDRTVSVLKNEGKPLSRIITEANLNKYWEIWHGK